MSNFYFKIEKRESTEEERQNNNWTEAKGFGYSAYDVYQCLAGHDTVFVCTCKTKEEAEKVGKK